MPRSQAWDPLDREGGKAYAAFCHYRDLGPRKRSLNLVVAEGFGKRRQIATWSSRYHWPDRARAWDVHADQRNRQAYIDRQIKYNRAVADEAEAVRSVLTLPLRAMVNRLDREGLDRVLGELEAMRTTDLIALVGACAKLLPQVIEIEARAIGAVIEGPASNVLQIEAGDDAAGEAEARRKMIAAAGVMAKTGMLQLMPPKDAAGNGGSGRR